MKFKPSSYHPEPRTYAYYKEGLRDVRDLFKVAFSMLLAMIVGKPLYYEVEDWND